jgi:hypothetical protein
MIVLGGHSHSPRVKGRCEMIRQPTKESSVSVRAISVIPWIGGAVVLAIGIVIVSSSGHRKGSAALTPPADAALGRDSVAQTMADSQRASKPNQPVAPAVVAVTAGDAPSLKGSADTPSLKSPPALEQPPSAPEDRATSNPKRDDNVQPASAVAPAASSPSPATPSAPATDDSNTSASSAAASSPGTVNGRGYYRMRRRRLRRVSLSPPAEREPVERFVV